MSDLQNSFYETTETPHLEKLASYLDGLKRAGYSAATIRSYGDALRQAFGSLGSPSSLAARGALETIGATDLEAWLGCLRARGLADATLQLHARALRQFFGWLEERGELFENPAKALTLAKSEEKLPRVPTVEQVETLLSLPDVRRKTGLRDRALLEVAYSSGLRRSELIALSIFSADLDALQLRVTGKGRKERVVPLGRTAAKWLGNYLRHARPKLGGGKRGRGKPAGDALWLDQFGKALTVGGLQAIAYRYLRSAGFDFGLHGLRRACATHLLQNGAHLVTIQMMLGHADLRTLARYLKVDIAELQAMHAQTNPGK